MRASSRCVPRRRRPPRWGRLRQARGRPLAESSSGTRHRPAPGPPGAATPVRGGRARQGRASSVTQAEMNLPFITADASGPKHLNVKLIRSKFEQLTEDLVERCLGPVEQALGDASSPRTTSTRSSSSAVPRASRGSEPRPPAHRWQGPQHDRQPRRGRRARRGPAGGVIKGDVQDVVLLDVTPLSLGSGDHGRGDDEGHRTQHDDSGPAVGDVSRQPRTTRRQSTSSCSRGSASSPPTTVSLPASASRASAPRRAARRRSK